MATDGRLSTPGVPAEVALDAWKRLRALTDVVQEQQKEGEHLDRKVRFALIVMGLLNGAIVAESPMRWSFGASAASRSMLRLRCAPRLLSASA